MEQEITLYRKKPDFGAAGCTAWLFLFSITVGIIVSLFSEDPGAVKLFFYMAAITVLILVITGVMKYISNRKNGVMMLSISKEGIHYYGHSSLVNWEKISNIKIINQQLSVTTGSSPAPDFTLNLYDTDLQDRSDILFQLLSNYYSRKIYIYDSMPSFGC